MALAPLTFRPSSKRLTARTLASIGVSKVVTLTSTYDHRIIQGAESGLFLKKIHELLTGEDGFYDTIFHSLGVPYEPARWHADTNPLDDEQGKIEKQAKVWNLINMYRVRGHLIADLDPLAINEPHTHSELDPITYGLSIWDNDREFYTGGLAGERYETLGQHSWHFARRLLSPNRCRVHAHSEPRREALDSRTCRGRKDRARHR